MDAQQGRVQYQGCHELFILPELGVEDDIEVEKIEDCAEYDDRVHCILQLLDIVNLECPVDLSRQQYSEPDPDEKYEDATADYHYYGYDEWTIFVKGIQVRCVADAAVCVISINLTD